MIQLDESVQEFSEQIRRGLYPKKCLRCVYDGILFCRYWFLEFGCEAFDKMRVMHKLEQLLGGGLLIG